MSKKAKLIALNSIEKIKILFGDGRPLSQVKGDADYIMNLGFYDMDTGKPVGHLKADGKVYVKESWNCWGYTWDTNDIRMDLVPDRGGNNYVNGVALLTPDVDINTPLSYRAEVGGHRPRTALALTDNSLLLFCSDTAMTPEMLREDLYSRGAKTALMMDSGDSTQCNFNGDIIESKTRPTVHNYLAVWLKKEEPPVKKVVLDPGHGIETPGKRSPDETYFEYEFNMDMAQRIKKHLARHGVEVILTREDEHEPVVHDDPATMEKLSLAHRVKVSNDANPDLFVSIHSNAAGNGTDWTSARGFSIYTSSAGDTKGRNIAAKAILARVEEAGITINGGLLHNRLYVLRNTDDPAVLLEHLFHDNKEDLVLLKDPAYREKMAVADAKGILDYLGIPWAEKPAEGLVCPHCGGLLKLVKG